MVNRGRRITNVDGREVKIWSHPANQVAKFRVFTRYRIQLEV